MRHGTAGALLVVVGILASAAAQRQAAVTARPFEVVFTRVFAGHTNSKNGAHLVLLAKDGSSRDLTPDFASAADPEVSFDAKHILFAGKRSAGDDWNIYEMKADGSGVRQITRGLGNCRSPIYQSSIFYLDDPGPMPQIAFASDRPEQYGEFAPLRATALYSARLDGSGVRRLTFNPSGAFDPVMLPDGRMLFSAWRRNPGGGPRGRIELMGVNIDGTDYATFSGGQGRGVQRMATVTAKRLVLFVDTDAADGYGGGPLAVIDLRRNLHSYRRLAAPGQFHSPSPLPDGTVLVAWRPEGSAGTYGIYRFDPQSEKLRPVVDSPAADDIQPRALVLRQEPDGRSSVVEEKQTWAKLYCLNLYTSDLSPEVWTRGLVKRLRVLEALPRSRPASGSLSPLLRTRFLGEVDVDPDGSFNLEIPADVPFQLQALDADGMALRTSAWMWAKNREQRGCIGCHEDGERTPENVMASALTRPSINLMLPPERRRTVQFERDVAPILREKCATAACHGARFSLTYQNLMRGTAPRYVTPGQARTSPLVWAIYGRNTSRPWDHSTPAAGARRIAPMPPQGAAPLTEDEKRVIVEWIDTGADSNSRSGGRAAGGQP